MPQDTNSQHHPVKSIKIDFHDATGMVPKLPPAPTIDPNATKGGMTKEPAPQPQTELSPLEEALFPHWATANGIDESAHAAPDNHYDYRGIYKQTNGQVHPPGTIEKIASGFNKLQQNPFDYNRLNQQPQAPAQPTEPAGDPVQQLMQLLKQQQGQ